MRKKHGKIRELRLSQAFMLGIHEVTENHNQRSAGTDPINFKNSCNSFVRQPVFKYAAEWIVIASLPGWNRHLVRLFRRRHEHGSIMRKS